MISFHVFYPLYKVIVRCCWCSRMWLCALQHQQGPSCVQMNSWKHTHTRFSLGRGRAELVIHVTLQFCSSSIGGGLHWRDSDFDLCAVQPVIFAWLNCNLFCTRGKLQLCLKSSLELEKQEKELFRRRPAHSYLAFKLDDFSGCYSMREKHAFLFIFIYRDNLETTHLQNC